MSHEHFWEVCLPLKDGEIPKWKCECGATKQEEFPILDLDDFDKQEEMIEGAKVETDLQGGMRGEIVGIAESGESYIIKINERIGEVWKKHPYSCVVIPRDLLKKV